MTQPITQAEVEEIYRHKQYHGHCLGHRQVDKYYRISLLDLLLDDYMRLRALERDKAL